ncbi:MAG TPA: type II secretion system protein GspJ [Burkholderiaceae bacterium]|nr:type II secretion system protein GspJ [Burkholderiaceae bacterium]
MKHRFVSRGFTLLELLVAITVLSIVSMIAWRGLDSLVATRERLEPEVDDVRSLLTAFGQMERDLTQVANPTFLGLAFPPLNVGIADGGQVIELARVASPVADRATEVQTVFYRVVDGSLVRQATPPLPAFDRANAESFETARLMNNVKSMTVRVWLAPSGWVSPFASDGSVARPQTGQTPPGVEVTLVRADGKAFRRVFLVGA